MIKCSTLVETLVAMIIVMLSFGIGLMIYLNITQSEGFSQKIKARLQMNQISVETIEKNLLMDEEYKKETIKIKKTIKPYEPDSPNLKLILLEAFDGTGKKIEERKELFFFQSLSEKNEISN